MGFDRDVNQPLCGQSVRAFPKRDMSYTEDPIALAVIKSVR
jgi:hypothetical protein